MKEMRKFTKLVPVPCIKCGFKPSVTFTAWEQDDLSVELEIECLMCGESLMGDPTKELIKMWNQINTKGTPAQKSMKRAENRRLNKRKK